MRPVVQTGGTHDAPPRETFVGASEVAALFGLDPFKTRWQIWAEKAGKIPPMWEGDTELTRVAKRMEDLVADEWAFHHPEGCGYWRNRIWYPHPEWPEFRAGASLDYVARAPGPGPNRRVHALARRVNPGQAIECKTTSARARDDWEDDDAPLHNRLQVQLQIVCSRFELDTLAYLIDRKYEDYPQEPHRASQEKLTDGIAEFWKSVDDGDEPPFDGIRDAEAWRYLRLLGDAPTETLEGDEKTAAMIRDVVVASAEAKRWETDRKRLAGELAKIAEGYRRVVCPGGEKFTIVRRPAKEATVVIAEHEGQEIVVKPAAPGTEYASHFSVPKEATAE